MNKKLLGVLGVAALLLAGNFAWQESKTVNAEGTYDEVQTLFEKYYNGGTYTKETQLNVNSDAIQEVSKYFHASANTRFRKTEYKLGELTMVTKSAETDDWGTNTSTYKDNGAGGVDHLRNGVKDYSVSGGNRSSVENWFVTLDDFKESALIDWTLDNGVYSFDLSTNTDMQRMAREFVAPMWLDTTEAANYVTFDKLTVEETGETLVMKLYVSTVDSEKLLEGSELVFSQATISLAHTCEYTVLNKDTTNHWYECECGEVDESTKEAHSYNKVTWDYNVKNQDCSCGYSTSQEQLVFKLWTNDWSNSDSAKIYIYYWGDNKSAKWAECTFVKDNGDYGDYYEVTLDVSPADYTKYIVVRGTAASWNKMFNQTGDLLYKDFLSTWKTDGKVTFYF